MLFVPKTVMCVVCCLFCKLVIRETFHSCKLSYLILVYSDVVGGLLFSLAYAMPRLWSVSFGFIAFCFLGLAVPACGCIFWEVL